MKILHYIYIAACISCIISMSNQSVLDSSTSAQVTLLDSSLIDVVWCGNNDENDKNVLILSSQGTVYKSSDRGDQWEKLSDLFQSIAIKAVQNLDTKTGYINRIVKSPVDPNLVMFLGSEGINFISEDCGNTIKSYGKGYNFREFLYHPTERNWVLASAFRNCKASKNPEKCVTSREMYLSIDLGRSWDKLADYVVQFSWGTKSQNSSNIPKERIIWSQEIGAQGHQKISGWNMNTHLFYSDNFLKSKTMVANQGNKFLFTSNYIFVAQVADAQSQKVNLLYADANTKDMNFEYAQIPEDLKQHSFTILDSSDGSIFININHLMPNSPLGTIYKSDSTGGKFIKSLDHNIRDQGNGQCDFERVSGMEGVYIANVYKKSVAEEFITASKSEDNDQIQFETTKNGKTQIATPLKSATQKLSESRQTLISFDQGSIWKPLSPPLKDSEGKPINCDVNGGCSLHLHSVSSKMQFGPFYTSDNALGIIMGTGNVGRTVKFRKDQVNTYLSRDAGLTWFEVKKGSHIYEFADHGGLILMADDQEATEFVYFSWDEGLTWSKVKFWDTKVEISNIITEPSNVGQRFLVYGVTTVKTNNATKTQGVIISIDFNQLHVKQCAGADQPNTDDSDYELWTPNGKLSPECLMGRKVTYVRRKRIAKCFNGQKFDRKVKVDNCQCTEEDWECDFNYERVNGEGPCVTVGNEYVKQSGAPPAQCSGYYTVTQGYRKIKNNSCFGGIDHSPIKYGCPYFSFLGLGSSWSGLFMWAVIFGGCYLLYKEREQVLEHLETLKAAVSKVISVNKLRNEESKYQGFGSQSGGSSSSSSSNLKNSSQKSKNNGGYIDFSQMDFEKNEDGSHFDENLVEHRDSSYDGEKLVQDEEEETVEVIKQGNRQTQQKQQELLKQDKQSQLENSNLLDGDDHGDDYNDDDEDDGFDPRK